MKLQQAGAPTTPDSGKTPQLRISKLAQNCGKTEFLHLKPSYGICWSCEIETLPPVWTKDSSGFKYILLFNNRMILNFGRHTQSDLQSCRVRSLGGEGGGPKTNNASRDQNKAEQCDARSWKNDPLPRQTQKRHPASNVAAESAPHPCHAVKACANDPNNSKQHSALAKIGNMLFCSRRGYETFNQQPFPGILSFCWTCKSAAVC